MFLIKKKKKQILAFSLIFLILLNLTGLIFKMRAAATPYIKWVSFTPTLEAIRKAYEVDTEFSGKIKMYEVLAYYSSRFGDKYTSFSSAKIDELSEKIKGGETLSSLTKDLKTYEYYKESYKAVLGEWTGEYTENGETKYGLKVFSPVASGYYYSHTDDFGNGRNYGFKRKHLGNDLFGSVGTPLVAVESGTVDMIGWNKYGGWRVGISSFDGKRYYYYAHLRKDHPYNENIKIGEVVRAGDVLGYLGATGYSDKENVNGMKRAHLHFGVQLIFHPSQKKGNNEIWIDVYNIVRFLRSNSAEVKKAENGEHLRKYDFCEENLKES